MTGSAQQPIDASTAAEAASERPLLELEAALDSVLSIRHAQRGGDPAERRIALLRHELRLLHPDVEAGSSTDQVRGYLRRVTDAELKLVASRALYYACHDLVTLLAHKYVKGDMIAREEAVLYVQERLQRDDFRRIRGFDPQNGAVFRTYIWRVISHLLIDFARAHHRLADAQQQSADAAHDADEPSPPAPEALVADQQLNEALSAVLQESPPAVATLGSLRERLRAHLDLSSTERLFLKAMFRYDMSVEEVRELPGFEMTRGEAWRFYYGLMDRLLDAFKDAGVLPLLRTLIDEREPSLNVVIERRPTTAPIGSISCVRHRDGRSSWCHLARASGVVTGIVMESFPKLRTRLAPWFSPINANAIVADQVLAARAQLWQSAEPAFIAVDGIAEPLPVGRAQAAALRRRFARKGAT